MSFSGVLPHFSLLNEEFNGILLVDAFVGVMVVALVEMIVFSFVNRRS